ncbi:MAG: Thiol-disulfide isomerase, partial [Myxococcales bacterium]|nr:Thiol-disulfide isomerase [Myxococcales bacterium]
MLRAVPFPPTLALLLTLASAHGAPTPEEERLFNEGLHAFDAGDARGAERAWKQGYAVAHDPAFLVRIGEAEEKAGAAAEAADSYRRYLREAPDASDKADLEQRLARLAPPPAGAPPSEPAREFGDAP